MDDIFKKVNFPFKLEIKWQRNPELEKKMELNEIWKEPIET